jgi:hypothetical protein
MKKTKTPPVLDAKEIFNQFTSSSDIAYASTVFVRLCLANIQL